MFKTSIFCQPVGFQVHRVSMVHQVDLEELELLANWVERVQVVPQAKLETRVLLEIQVRLVQLGQREHLVQTEGLAQQVIEAALV